MRGRKRLRLVPPAATPHLQAQPVTHESANHSPADLGSPDLERFPGLAAALAAAQEFEVEAGDALFIPEGWWHQVRRRGHACVNVGAGLGRMMQAGVGGAVLLCRRWHVSTAACYNLLCLKAAAHLPAGGRWTVRRGRWLPTFGGRAPCPASWAAPWTGGAAARSQRCCWARSCAAECLSLLEVVTGPWTPLFKLLFTVLF